MDKVECSICGEIVSLADAVVACPCCKDYRCKDCWENGDKKGYRAKDLYLWLINKGGLLENEASIVVELLNDALIQYHTTD